MAADLNVEGLVTVVAFYLLIILVGIAASRSRLLRLTGDDDSAEMSMVAGRNLGLIIGVFTMAGQWSPLKDVAQIHICFTTKILLSNWYLLEHVNFKLCSASILVHSDERGRRIPERHNGGRGHGRLRHRVDRLSRHHRHRLHAGSALSNFVFQMLLHA